MKTLNILSLRKGSFFLFLAVLVFTQAACFSIFTLRKVFKSSTSPLSSSQTRKDVFAKELKSKFGSDAIEKQIHDLFLEKDFSAIEKIADEAREKKQRFKGARWKLQYIYTAISNIYAEYPGQKVSEELWENHIEIVKKWKLDSPKSITARVALAKSYAGYGWFARGNGYINTVSKKNYKLFHTRLKMAEKELLEARSLDIKCPSWYREMLFVGMVRSWSQDRFDDLYEEAINFEPNYLQFYLIKSEYLTPKWSGKRGDWQRYVDALPSKLALLDTNEANIIYFVVVVNKLRDNSIDINWAMIAKERIQKGFSDIENKYSADNLRLNQYAFVSCLTMNLPAAKEAFKRIGDKRNSKVWKASTFNLMRDFAFNDEMRQKQFSDKSSK